MPAPTLTRRSRETLVVAAMLALLWAFFALIAAWAPALLDDWYQVDWLQRHELTPRSVLEYGVYNYFNHNPRFCENLLLLVNGPRALHVLLTPTVELTLLLATFATAFGRWPTLTYRDAGRLFLAQALIWMVAPIPGTMYFYRPFTTNYLFGVCFQLLLVLPYRFALARPTEAPRHGWIPLMLVGGWIAGMCNEHTGPAVIVAVLALVFLAWRQGRLRPWMIAGAVGLIVGFLMLLGAPGQKVRYAGMADRSGPLELIRDRGIDGSFEVLLGQALTAEAAILVVGAALLVATLRAQRRGGAVPVPPRGEALTAAVLLFTAGAIAATLSASPLVGERLYFAPSVLVVAAALLFLDGPLADPLVRRLLTAFAVVVLLVHVVVIGIVYKVTYDEWLARDAALRATPKGETGPLVEFTFPNRTRWALGDDLRAEYLRDYVSHEVYDLPAIEYAEPSRLVQPRLPWSMELDVAFDPPLPQDELWRRVEKPLRYVPSRPDRVILMLRKVMPALKALPGHRLVSITATVTGLDFPELRGRPIRALIWTGDTIKYVDSKLSHDNGIPTFVLYRKSVPPGMTDAYVRACGATQVAKPRTIEDGVALPFRSQCRGVYAAVVCTADTCWLAGSRFQ